jgi:hypothetical protein
VDRGEFEDFEFALAVGRDYRCYIADLLAEESAADGRRGRDEALGDVRLFAGDELVGNLFVLGAVEDDDGRAEADAVARDVFEDDHGELAHALFELAETRVDEYLTLLGRVVFGVFREVAEGDGLLDLGGQFGGELVLELLDLLFDGFFDVFHDSGVCFAGPRLAGSGKDDCKCRKEGSGFRVQVWVGEQGRGLAAEPGFEDERGGDLVDDFAAGLAVLGGVSCSGAVEDGVGRGGGVALVEEMELGGRDELVCEVLGEVGAEGFGEGFGFGGLRAGFSGGVDGETDEDCGYVVTADEAGDGF